MNHFKKYKQLIAAKEFELVYYTCIATGFVSKEQFVKDVIIESFIEEINFYRSFSPPQLFCKKKYKIYMVVGGYSSRPHTYINGKTYFPKNAKSQVEGEGFLLNIRHFPNQEIKEILLKHSNYLIEKWIQ